MLLVRAMPTPTRREKIATFNLRLSMTTERIDFITGQVAALKSICIALIVHHSDRKSLLPHLTSAGEATTESMRGTHATEATIAGVASVHNELLAALQTEIEGNRSTDSHSD